MTLTADPPVDPGVPAGGLLAAAAAGDRVARRHLGALVLPHVARYCRARLGRGPAADDLAREICRAVVAAIGPCTTTVPAFHALAYRIASSRVARVCPAAGELPGQLGVLRPRQREVMVLRVAVGLSADETAWALGTTPGAVRVVQHAALNRLRAEGFAAPQPGGRHARRESPVST